MKTAYLVCDRCQDVTQASPTFCGEGWSIAASYGVLGDGLPTKDLHFCPSCTRELQTWMTRIPVEVTA